MRRRGYRILAPVLLALAVTACRRVANSPSDSQIVSALDAELYQNPDLKSLPVNVSSRQGTVTLTGSVTAPLEKLAVEDLAMKTPGVKQVIDQLTVSAADPGQADLAPEASAGETAGGSHPARPGRTDRKPRLAENRNPSAPPGGGQDQGSIAPDSQSSQSSHEPQASQSAQAAQPAAPPPPVQVSIPPGATLSIRMIDAISSQNARPGQLYAASLAAPVVADGRVVIPQGADAKVRVVRVLSAGHYRGRSELELDLVQISYDGTGYPVATRDYVKRGSSRGKNTAEKVGGGAALGALIGGLIGHGTGAGIGAAIGGAAGTADQTATHGQQVTVPSEARIDFVLKAPLTLTINTSNP